MTGEPGPERVTSSVRSRLVAGGAWALGGSGAETLFALAENALLARLLLPAELGAYFLVLSLVTVAATLAQLGLGQAVVRLVAGALAVGDRGRARALIRRVLQLGGVGAVAGAAVLALGPGGFLLARVFHAPQTAAVLRLAGVWALLWAVRALLAETFRGLMDFRHAVIFAKASAVVVSILLYGGLLLLRGRGELDDVLWVCVISAAVSLAVASVVLRRRVRRLDIGPDVPVAAVWRSAAPLFANNVLALLFLHTNVWLLGALASPESVASFGAAMRLGVLAVLPLMIVNAVVPPLVAELHSRGSTVRLGRLLRNTAGAALVPGLVVAGAVFLFAGDLLRIVYGEFYSGAATALVWIAAGQVVVLATGSCGVTLIMTGHERLRLWITTLVGLAGVPLGFVLISGLGLTGAAVNVAVGLTLQNVAAWIAVRVKLGLWTHAGVGGIREIWQTAGPGRTGG